MPKKVGQGQYKVGEIDEGRKNGTYGVIKGEKANENGHEEWKHICDKALRPNKWFAYRIYVEPHGVSSTCVRTALMDVFDTKKDAVNFLQRRYGRKFDKEF